MRSCAATSVGNSLEQRPHLKRPLKVVPCTSEISSETICIVPFGCDEPSAYQTLVPVHRMSLRIAGSIIWECWGHRDAPLASASLRNGAWLGDKRGDSDVPETDVSVPTVESRAALQVAVSLDGVHLSVVDQERDAMTLASNLRVIPFSLGQSGITGSLDDKTCAGSSETCELSTAPPLFVYRPLLKREEYSTDAEIDLTDPDWVSLGEFQQAEGRTVLLTYRQHVLEF